MVAVDTSRRRRPHVAPMIRIVVTVLLGGIGAAAGFKHTHDWAVVHGQTGWLAWADAVVIEGIAVVAGFEIHRDRHHPGGPQRRVSLPVVVLVAGFTVQMAAQVALAEPTPAGWLLAAMPALGFLVVVKLLMRRTPVLASSETPSASSEAGVSSAETVATESSAPDPASNGTRSTSSADAPTGSRVRLAPGMTEAITRAVEEVRNEGREPTTADIRRVARVSDSLATQILDDLPARNGQPVT